MKKFIFTFTFLLLFFTLNAKTIKLDFHIQEAFYISDMKTYLWLGYIEYNNETIPFYVTLTAAYPREVKLIEKGTYKIVLTINGKDVTPKLVYAKANIKLLIITYEEFLMLMNQKEI